MASKRAVIILIILLAVMQVSAKSNKADFSIDQGPLRIQLKQGDSIDTGIKITNIENENISINISLIGIEKMAYVGKKTAILESGQSETINLKIWGRETGVITGKLILNSKAAVNELPILVEVESRKVMVDIDLTAAENATLQSNLTIPFYVELLNLIYEEPIDTKITYEVKDFNNTAIYDESSRIVLGKKTSYIKNIKIPENIEPGEYVVAARVDYENSTGTSAYIVLVTDNNFSNFAAKCGSNPYCGIGSIIIFAVIVNLLWILILRLGKKNPNMQETAEINAKMQKKLDALAEGYESGFISKESYEKSKTELLAMAKKQKNK